MPQLHLEASQTEADACAVDIRRCVYILTPSWNDFWICCTCRGVCDFVQHV